MRSDRRLVRDVLLDVFSLEDCIAHDTKAVQLRTQDSIYEFSEGSNWRKAQMHFSADISSDTVRVTIEGSGNSLNTFKFEHSCTWLKNRYGRKRYGTRQTASTLSRTCEAGFSIEMNQEQVTHTQHIFLAGRAHWLLRRKGTLAATAAVDIAFIIPKGPARIWILDLHGEQPLDG